jgi:hypothetical protein
LHYGLPCSQIEQAWSQAVGLNAPSLSSWVLMLCHGPTPPVWC